MSICIYFFKMQPKASYYCLLLLVYQKGTSFSTVISTVLQAISKKHKIKG
ncbi:hypothetical protein HMPREF9078_00469 [Capnocytophaga sp. oral taxon 380 str. F0488]|nr:hypothetical protein HMPREF9078_00469 [Capnocytophaga sp. oral taxon 380 str. F0488]